MSIMHSSHRINQLFDIMVNAFSLPVLLVMCTISVYRTVGLTFLVGLAIQLIQIKANTWFDKKCRERSESFRKIEERRYNYTSETISEIKTLKMYNWTDIFKNLILKTRREEYDLKFRDFQIDRLRSFVNEFLPRIQTSAIIVTHIALGNSLTLSASIQLMATFGNLTGQLNRLPHLYNEYWNLDKDLTRMIEFLNLPEIKPEMLITTCPDESIAIKIDSKSFSWGVKQEDVKETKAEERERLAKWGEKQEEEKEEETEKEKSIKVNELVHLKDINLEVKKGEFVCIIGEIGSGKSNLLQALIGDLLPVREEQLELYGKDEGYERSITDIKELREFNSDLLKNANLGT